MTKYEKIKKSLLSYNNNDTLLQIKNKIFGDRDEYYSENNINNGIEISLFILKKYLNMNNGEYTDTYKGQTIYITKKKEYKMKNWEYIVAYSHDEYYYMEYRFIQ